MNTPLRAVLDSILVAGFAFTLASLLLYAFSWYPLVPYPQDIPRWADPLANAVCGLGLKLSIIGVFVSFAGVPFSRSRPLQFVAPICAGLLALVWLIDSVAGT
jgi:hypothetical protein